MSFISTDDEYLDLVDENDNVIGKKKRSDVYQENISNYRVVNAFVVRSDSLIWIPRRSASKKYFPLSLDVSVGGHVESCESYQQALYREASEELNIDIGQYKNRLLGHLKPADGVSSFMNVYEIIMDETPHFNTNDFVEYFLLSPNDILEKVSNGEKAKTDLVKLVKLFYI